MHFVAISHTSARLQSLLAVSLKLQLSTSGSSHIAKFWNVPQQRRFAVRMTPMSKLDGPQGHVKLYVCPMSVSGHVMCMSSTWSPDRDGNNVTSSVQPSEKWKNSDYIVLCYCGFVVCSPDRRTFKTVSDFVPLLIWLMSVFSTCSTLFLSSSLPLSWLSSTTVTKSRIGSSSEL